MKSLLCHALIVTAALLGGDLRYNGGQDTEALLTMLRADVVAGGARLQAYHVNEDIDRQLALLMIPSVR